MADIPLPTSLSIQKGENRPMPPKADALKWHTLHLHQTKTRQTTEEKEKKET